MSAPAVKTMHSPSDCSLSDRELLDIVLQRNQLRIAQEQVEQVGGRTSIFTTQRQVMCITQILRNVGVEITRLGCDVSGDVSLLHPDSVNDFNRLAAWRLGKQFIGPKGETDWRQIVANFKHAPSPDLAFDFDEFTRTPQEDKGYIATIIPLQKWVDAETAHLAAHLLAIHTPSAPAPHKGARL